MALFPHNIQNLIAGPIRVLYAPIAQALPVGLDDIIDLTDPYDPVTGWEDVGATTDESEYSLDMESEGYEIQQTTAIVAEKITQTNRTTTVPMAEFTPELTKLAEEAKEITTIAAAAGASAQKAVDVGGIDSLTRYRFAFVAMRDQGFGNLVTEPGAGSVQRGAFVGFCAYSASIAAEEQSLSIDRENLSAREVTFAFYPDGAVVDPRKAVGRWFFEDAGTIA